jgi:hypothetical protein
MRKLIKIALLALLVFIGMLWYVLRTKVSDVSDQEPYSGIVNKTVAIKRQAFIALNVEWNAYDNPYLICESDSDFLSEVGTKYILPTGTVLTITEANIYTNGTSGFSSAYVLGTVYLKELKKEVAFEYRWGKQQVVIYGDSKDYWTFPLAIWQDNELNEKFYFE